jgi:hypothetical protein
MHPAWLLCRTVAYTPPTHLSHVCVFQRNQENLNSIVALHLTDGRETII